MNIIFIHKGDSWYLSYALKQVKKSNPNANIVLLGDERNKKYSKYAHFDYIDNYNKKAKEFENIYIHFSNTDYNYELFCIQRWFIWFEYMNSHNISKALLPDTDVLIFQDVTRYFNSVPDNIIYTKGFTNRMGFIYINIFHLESICSLITTSYSNKEIISELEHAYMEWVEKYKIGGISDMTFFYKYENNNIQKTFNLETPPINNQAFINSLSSPLYKKNKENFVVLKWRNGVPYAELLDGSGCVSILGTHCFGIQKKYIRKWYQGDNKEIARLIYYWKESSVKRMMDVLRGRIKLR